MSVNIWTAKFCHPDSLVIRKDDYDDFKAKHDALKAKYDDLMRAIVQPWTRDGDGAKLYKINVAWWDTAKTEADGIAMVEEFAARVRLLRERQAKS